LYFIIILFEIYTAKFHPPNEIRITFVRKLEIEKRELQGESIIHSGMLISREINGKEVIYRACDDPKNGIIVDVEEEKLRGCEISAIHRGRLIYARLSSTCETVINLSPNIIVVNTQYSNIQKIFADDDSPLVFFCPFESNSCSLFVLDTTTMGILSIKLPRVNWNY
ncbi:hypothetical protein PFISCL1PPCAC_16991, partial [Pristionchus fissidentatus]